MNLIKILILALFLHVTIYAEPINIDNIVSQAKKENKQVLLFFNMTRCGACKEMIKTSIEDADIRRRIDRDFLYVGMNINSKDEVIHKTFKGSVHGFAKSLGINLYPSAIFLGCDNEQKYHLVGYRDKDKFSTIIEYVSTKSYKSMDLESFINEKDFND
ncbi:thioredoxin fold domain-containing protein [Sulfurimonas sp.]|uniref:thioredoxin family protein n=1 Tax=Sulfurimonas sp. TaxID=2022749 RepID=UPI0025F0ACCB|nr:thioredoxin fold domain-containing protein [Sulfurimonas sp.]MBW6489331.1 thioredoxin fold domain-containing protein [Sulfurimonas sp.]